MNIFNKIRNCITQKMVARQVPVKIANKFANEFVTKEVTPTEMLEINKGNMKLDYCNRGLEIKKVNISKCVANTRLMSLTTPSLSIVT